MNTGSHLYFQTTLCQSQMTNLGPSLQFVISATSSVFTTTNPAVTTAPTYLAQRDCTTAALTRAFFVHIYYVANNDVAGDGIPTLKRVALGATSFSSPVAIAEGIETMQIEYGLDDGTNGGVAADGAPDSWSIDPSTGTVFQKVTALKVHLLARNTQSTGTFTDTRTYILGSVASTDNTFGPYNDAYKRHAYSTVVRLTNVGGRRE
jgi:type IV pilus assembly protein PilW